MGEPLSRGPSPAVHREAAYRRALSISKTETVCEHDLIAALSACRTSDLTAVFQAQLANPAATALRGWYAARADDTLPLIVELFGHDPRRVALYCLLAGLDPTPVVEPLGGRLAALAETPAQGPTVLDNIRDRVGAELRRAIRLGTIAAFVPPHRRRNPDPPFFEGFGVWIGDFTCGMEPLRWAWSINGTPSMQEFYNSIDRVPDLSGYVAIGDAYDALTAMFGLTQDDARRLAAELHGLTPMEVATMGREDPDAFAALIALGDELHMQLNYAAVPADHANHGRNSAVDFFPIPALPDRTPTTSRGRCPGAGLTRAASAGLGVAMKDQRSAVMQWIEGLSARQRA